MWCRVSSSACSSSRTCTSRARIGCSTARSKGRDPASATSSSRRRRAAAGSRSRRSTSVHVVGPGGSITCTGSPSASAYRVRRTSCLATTPSSARCSAATSRPPRIRSMIAIRYSTSPGRTRSRIHSPRCPSDGRSGWSRGASGMPSSRRRGPWPLNRLFSSSARSIELVVIVALSFVAGGCTCRAAARRRLAERARTGTTSSRVNAVRVTEAGVRASLPVLPCGRARGSAHHRTVTNPFSPVPPLWRNRDFLLLWSGTAVSNLGSNCSNVAYPMLVLVLTGSPAQAGLTGFVALLPQLLFQLPAGAVADSWNRKRVMIWCDALRMLVLGSLVVALLADRLTVTQILFVGFVEGTLTVVHRIAASAAVPNLVHPSHLTLALSRNEARTRGAAMVGQPLGGALFGVARLLPFLVDALSYVVSLVTLVLIKGDFQTARSAAARRRPAHVLHDILEG